MSTLPSMKELLKMDKAELLRDVQMLSQTLAKSRLGLEVSKEKDSASYRRNKRQKARILAAIGTLAQALPVMKKSSKLSARQKGSTDQK